MAHYDSCRLSQIEGENCYQLGGAFEKTIELHTFMLQSMEVLSKFHTKIT